MRLLILLFTFHGSILSAQLFHAEYEAQINTVVGSATSGKNSLYFTVDSAIYIHDDYPEESNYSMKGNTVNRVIGDEYGKPILTLRTTDQQRFKEEYQAAQSMFILTEPIPKIEWKIGRATSGESAKTKKATGWYGGREYEVWFNPNLPFPYGPHRLYGLPGLIIRAQSTDGVVNYRLVKFGKVTDPTIAEHIFSLGPGIPISKEEHQQRAIKVLLRSEARSTADMTVTAEDPPADYTVEKNRWTIISDYKKKRGY